MIVARAVLSTSILAPAYSLDGLVMLLAANFDKHQTGVGFSMWLGLVATLLSIIKSLPQVMPDMHHTDQTWYLSGFAFHL